MRLLGHSGHEHVYCRHRDRSNNLVSMIKRTKLKEKQSACSYTVHSAISVFSSAPRSTHIPKNSQSEWKGAVAQLFLEA